MTKECLVCDTQTTNARSVQFNGAKVEAPVCKQHTITDDALINVIRGNVTPKMLLDDLRRVAEEVGRSPTCSEYREHGKYGYHKFYDGFGSWNNAKAEAGLEPRKSGKDPTSKEAIIEDVRRVADELGEQPCMRDYSRADGTIVDVKTIYRRIGTWDEVLEEAFGATA